MSLDSWIQSAYANYQRLELPLDKLLRSHDIVRVAIGAEWFEDQAAKLYKKIYTITEAHPLYRAMTSSALTALVEVSELAAYLDAFKDDLALRAVIQDLRSAKYQSSFFELAMAYRFKSAGTAVRLQPRTDAGNVADFCVTLNDLDFTVEASVCPENFFASPRYRAPQIAAVTVGSVMAGQFPIALKLRVGVFPGGNWEARLQADVRDVCLRLKAQHARSEPVVASATNELWTIEGEKVGPQTLPVPKRADPTPRWVESEWDVCFRTSSVPRKEGQTEGDAARTNAHLATEVARIFAKFPADHVDPYDTITRKANREARQLRGIRGPRVVMLDITGVQGDVLQLEKDQVLASLAKCMRNTPELAAVFLQSRKFSTALRFQYRTSYVTNGQSVYQLPAWIMDKLIEVEWVYDFLGEREMPATPEGDAMRDYWARMKQEEP